MNVTFKPTYGYVSRLIDRAQLDINLSSYKLLRFTLDLTYGFKNQSSAIIPRQRFLEGIKGVCAGLNMSDRMLRKCFDVLKKAGVLDIWSTSNGAREYKINIAKLEELTPYTAELKQTFARYQGGNSSSPERPKYQPKNLLNRNCSSEQIGTRVPPRAQGYARANILVKKEYKTLLRKPSVYSVSAPPTPGDEKVFRKPPSKEKNMRANTGNRASSVLEVARLASAGTTASQTRRVEKGKLDALLTYYQRLVKDKFGTPDKTTSHTHKDLAIFKKTFVEGLEGNDTREFMESVVNHWTEIITTRFRWMSQPPDHPNLLFICRHVHKFLDATLTIKRGEPLRAKHWHDKRIAELEDKGILADKKRISELEREVYALQERQRTQLVVPRRPDNALPRQSVVLPPEEGMPET